MDRLVCIYFFDHKTEDQAFLADSLLRLGYDCTFKNHPVYKGVLIQNVDPNQINDSERTRLIVTNEKLTYADHWRGTITGQVFTALGIEPTEQALLASAYTYCLSAAYSGLCKGVSESAVMQARVNLLAYKHDLSPEDVISQINRDVDLISELPYALDGVRDLTELEPGQRPPFYFDACLQLNEGFLIKDHDNKRIRYEIGGRVAPDVVLLFMGEYRKRLGVKYLNAYPYRMTATGYTE